MFTINYQITLNSGKIIKYTKESNKIYISNNYFEYWDNVNGFNCSYNLNNSKSKIKDFKIISIKQNKNEKI